MLTGATGFVGMELLARFLESSDRHIVALVRAADDEQATAEAPDQIPLLPLRSDVVFPQTVVPLVVNRPADQLWGPVRDFWQESGLLLALDQPNLGIMETDWAENRAKIDQGKSFAEGFP